MAMFLSCDWGTSSFRLKLIDSVTMKVLAGISNSQGCAKTNQDFLDSKSGEPGRLCYYQNIISGHINRLKDKTGINISRLPLIISGMASSTIGMINLPYKDAPFLTNGSDLNFKLIDADEIFPHQTLIISGVKTANDVMRGEETKLTGCFEPGAEKESIIILPGTHPKHVYVKNNLITGFKTYMTGEFFELLSQKSILSLSVLKPVDFDDASFTEGVKTGAGSNLLNSSFLVRTNILFDKYSLQQNYAYLSGLLIGTELKEFTNLKTPVSLLSGDNLSQPYKKAAEVLNIGLDKLIDADKALIRGQWQVYNSAVEKKNH